MIRPSANIVITWAFWQSPGHMMQMSRTINKKTIRFFSAVDGMDGWMLAFQHNDDRMMIGL